MKSKVLFADDKGMKLKTQILVAVVSTFVLHLLLPGYADTTKPERSAKQTFSPRNVITSYWQDVTTPILSGFDHENHRGSAWCDYDNDGLLDLYITHFGTFEPGGEYQGSPNQLLKNNGDGNFEDVTTYELEAYFGLSHHATWADIDNDGLPDLYVTQSSYDGQRSVLLHHDTTGNFSDITSGDISMEGILPRSVGWQDINNNGLVDLLVAVSASPGGDKINKLLINKGNGTFELSTDTKHEVFFEGIHESRSIGWCDFNNDNYPDVYITNGAEDHSDENYRLNQLFKNPAKTGENWIEMAEIAGVDDAGHGRGQAWGDINNDGLMDLFVGNQKGSDTGGGHNRMYLNNGDETFKTITNSAGLLESFRTRCVSMADFDNDGFLDIYIVNFGNAQPPNHLYRNNGDLTFTEVASGTPAAGGLENGSSATWADYDNDGWIDLYIVGGSTDAPGVGMNRLVRNANHNGNHWLEVELCGVDSNRTAIGARVTITHRNGSNQIVTQMRDIQSGSGYNSAHMLRAHFGLGTSERIIDLSVRWPSGVVQTVSNLLVDKIIRVVEDSVFAYDCNRNCIPDYQDIDNATSLDTNGNGIPDECEDGCLGDVNGDTVVDVNDLVALISEWGSTNSPDADLNEDGVVDVNDIIILISAWGTCDYGCLGDVNGDTVVDVNDLMALMSAWGSTNSPEADLNKDGVVDVNDFVILISAWGSCN